MKKEKRIISHARNESSIDSVTGKDGEKLIWKENYQHSEDKFWWLKDNADKKRKPVNPTTKYSILKRK